MSAFRTAYQFFKTWFLPQTFDDEETISTPAAAEATGPREPADRVEVPPPSNAPTPFTEPAVDQPAAEKPVANPDLKESTSQASYAIPPVPAAMQPREPDPPAAMEDHSSTVNPADDPASFSHLVKPPNAADQRYSRRRMEGADPSAFE